MFRRILPAIAALTMLSVAIAQDAAPLRAPLEAGIATVKFIESVPEADKDPVAQHLAALEAAFEAQQAQ